MFNKKSCYVLAILIVFTFFGSMAFAAPGGVPGPPEWGGGSGGSGGNHNTTITNNNTNVNTNVNVNDNDSSATALSGSSSSATGGNATGGNVSMTIEDRPDHIRGPEIVSPDAKLSLHEASTYKMFGSVMDRMKSCSLEQAKLLADGADDAVITPAVIVSHDFINIGHLHIGNTSGVFMGYLYADSDGEDVTAAGLEGAAMEKALKLGATGIVKVRKSGSVQSTGSAWNIGVGGGASILSEGGHSAVAPNGGTGYGHAWASNEYRPEMVFEIYCDETILVKKPKYDHQFDNDTNPLAGNY